MWVCVCVCVQMRSGLRLQHVGGGPSCRIPVARMVAPETLEEIPGGVCVCKCFYGYMVYVFVVYMHVDVCVNS